MSQRAQRVAFQTLGCKLNQAEEAALRRGFEDRGYAIVEFLQEADICLINTCAVTERADQKCRQAIRQAVRAAPEAMVIVTGCYAQIAADRLRAIPGVAMVLGAGEKFKVFEYLEQWDGTPFTQHSRHENQFALEDTFGVATDRTRAFVKIQDGCGFACRFCIIPTTRGDSRSRPAVSILRQFRQLAAEGFREVVLTGVNLIQYRDPDVRNLAGLVRALKQSAGSTRIRLGSIEPNGIRQALIDELADGETVCNHLHVPLQSGDAGVLEAMGRKYTPSEYHAIVTEVAERIPGVGIGADVMVGFPGETDRAFRNTCQLIADLPLTYLHVFQFSPRSGTPAATMANPIPPAIMQERSRHLRALGAQKQRDFLASNVGRVHQVLLEQEHAGVASGLSANYLRVRCPAVGLTNTVVAVEATRSDGEALWGETLIPAVVCDTTPATACPV